MFMSRVSSVCEGSAVSVVSAHIFVGAPWVWGWLWIVTVLRKLLWSISQSAGESLSEPRPSGRASSGRPGHPLCLSFPLTLPAGVSGLSALEKLPFEKLKQ